MSDIYHFYICEDALPKFEKGALLQNKDVIHHDVIRNMLADDKYKWDEPPVKALLEKAAGNTSWQIRAVRSPEFLLRDIESSLDRPDVLVFDWDYPGVDGSAVEGMLLDFLNKTYCLVQVYSGCDKVDEICAILEQPKFYGFKQRVFTEAKDSVDADALLEKAAKCRASNLSLQLGSMLRNTAMLSLDKILVTLGQLHINELMDLLAVKPGGENDFKNVVIERLRNNLRGDADIVQLFKKQRVSEEAGDELLNIVVERLRADLDTLSSANVPAEGGGEVLSQKLKVAESIWSYRLYHTPADNRVRCGDIIRNKQDRKCHIVVSADCDLARFWHKNSGFISLVPIYEITDDDSEGLKSRFRFDVKKWKNFATPPFSLTGKPDKCSDGIHILPLVQIGANKCNYLVISKGLSGYYVKKPDGVGAESRLTYTEWSEYERICSISAPFLMPFVKQLIESISGFGVPDYPVISQTAGSTGPARAGGGVPSAVVISGATSHPHSGGPRTEPGIQYWIKRLCEVIKTFLKMKKPAEKGSPIRGFGQTQKVPLSRFKTDASFHLFRTGQP